MKYTLYGLVVESDWHFSYFSIYCGKRTPDVTVVVKLADQEHIPSVFKFGLNWLDLSIPGVIEYTYKQSVIDGLSLF